MVSWSHYLYLLCVLFVQKHFVQIAVISLFALSDSNGKRSSSVPRQLFMIYLEQRNWRTGIEFLQALL